MSDQHEAARLNALRQLNLLDTSPSESFDRITRMASQLFNLPIAAISLTDMDRQWFKSRVGVEHWQIPRERAPCAEVATTADTLVLPDLLEHPCYKDSLLAGSGIRFYAGAPLVTREGYGLGAMCVLGTEPREATQAELAALSDLAAMVMSQIELQHAFGRIDPLSGMPNRNQFIDDLHDLAREVPAGARRLAVMIDLATTDQLNHAMRAVGTRYLDELIGGASQFLAKILSPGQAAYHVAGSQFAFLVADHQDQAGQIAVIAEQLRRFEGETGSRFVSTCCIGVAPFVVGETSPETVLRTAHSAAQDARTRESRISVYSADQDAAHGRRFQLIQDFAAALEAGDQLRLVYQPKIDLASMTCHSAEALIRWRHPSLGEVSPGEFAPLIEQTTMARAMTHWVLEAALRQVAEWRAGGIDLQVAVNISTFNLREGDFAQQVQAALARHGVPAACLELEITESGVMHDQAFAQLHALAAAGIPLAIDDFGTGYSNFSYLQSLPIRVVKIDQSFIQDMTADKLRCTLVASLVNLSHDLGYRVVAEGVETPAAVAALARMGCDEAQGYNFGRPMTPPDFELWLENFAAPAPTQLLARAS